MIDKEYIYYTLNYLLAIARDEEARTGKHCNLKWEIGIEIKSILMQDLIMYCSLIDERETRETLLMGLPAEINYKQPDIIKLWREVER